MEDLALKALALGVHVDLPGQPDTAAPGPGQSQIAQRGPLHHHQRKIRGSLCKNKGDLTGVAALRRYGIAFCGKSVCVEIGVKNVGDFADR